jgi:hypothetical protein
MPFIRISEATILTAKHIVKAFARAIAYLRVIVRTVCCASNARRHHSWKYLDQHLSLIFERCRWFDCFPCCQTRCFGLDILATQYARCRHVTRAVSLLQREENIDFFTDCVKTLI